jgi:hypothetical protein
MHLATRPGPSPAEPLVMQKFESNLRALLNSSH